MPHGCTVGGVVAEASVGQLKKPLEMLTCEEWQLRGMAMNLNIIHTVILEKISGSLFFFLKTVRQPSSKFQINLSHLVLLVS